MTPGDPFEPSGVPAVNPLSQILGAFLLTVPALASFDRVTPWIALGLGFPAIALCLRPSLRAWARLAFPLAALSVGAGISNLLFAVPRTGVSDIAFRVGPAAITAFALDRSLSVMGRTLSLSIIMTLTSASMSAVSLVRALMQNCGLSPRWGYALYAGLNIVPRLLEDLENLQATRRVRLAGRRERKSDALSLPIYLLAGAIRRAERASLSMVVRGLEEADNRTYLVKSPWRRRDTGYLILCAVLAASTFALSFFYGFFRWDLG